MTISLPRQLDIAVDIVNITIAVQVVRRVTLQRLMPDAGSVFSQLFTTLHIQEPCFTDLVILYRKSKQVLDRPSSEKDPLPKYSKASHPVGEVCPDVCHMPGPQL